MKFSDFSHSLDLDAIYVALDMDPINRIGDEDQFICPDWNGAHSHGDTTGKLFINREKMVGQCWVDGGISIPQLVAYIRDISYDEAVEWLFQYSEGGNIEEEAFMGKLTRMFEVKEQKKDVMPYFNEDVLSQFELFHPWFDERNISEAVHIEYRCGYDREHDAIILPHFWDGKLVGWQRRHLTGMPKYTNTPDFPKSQTLWGYDKAKDTPIIVESVPTALSLISYGFYGIATFGSNISEQQIRHLRKFTNGVILAPDNDAPGQKWFKTIFKYLDPFIPVYQVGLVEGQGSDLGDLGSYLPYHIRETLELVFDADLSFKV